MNPNIHPYRVFTYLAVGLVLLLTPVVYATETHAEWTRPIPANAPMALTEDRCAAGVNRCVWDARHRGNGQGRSFVLLRHRRHFHTRYVRHRWAHRLVRNWCARPDVDCSYR